MVKGLNFSYSEAAQQAGFSAEQWDAYAESTGALALQDEVGHGTHVASTVGGDGSLSGAQGGPDLAGVAPGVSLVSMRVATPGFGVVDDIDWEEAALAAFDWTIRHREESASTSPRTPGACCRPSRTASASTAASRPTSTRCRR